MASRSSKKSRSFKSASPSQSAVPRSQVPSIISRRGKRIVLIGIGFVIVGFCVLTQTDPAGQNWASVLSPFLLVFGYSAVGIGLVLKDPTQVATLPPAVPPSEN